jgi:hypothetical protein
MLGLSRLLLAVSVAGCGSAVVPEADAGRTPDASADAAVTSDSAVPMTDAGADAQIIAPPDAGIDGGETCTALPSGPLTRFAGNPLLRNGPEAYDLGKTGPRVVLREGSLYRIWYEAVDGLDPWEVTDVGYATSSNGLTWTKMGTVMSASSAWEGNEISPGTVLVEGGVYRLWYHAGGNELPHRNIGYATSADGLVWTRHPMPVLTVGPSGAFDDDEVAEPRVMRVGREYWMYYTGANESSRRKALGLATSPDGIVWTKRPENPLLESGRWGNHWGGAFFHEAGIWHLWHGVEASRGLHYMWSTDGIEWIDGLSNPVLRVSSDRGAADYGLAGDSVSGYRDGDVYRILYTGYNEDLFGSLGRFEGICMAEIASPCPR